MKTFRRFPLLILVAAMSGCISSQLMNRIAVGMTKDQVVAVLGKPDSMSVQAGVEYLTYYLPVVESSGQSEAMDLLKVGMTEDEIVSLLGQPGSESGEGSVKYMIYYLLTGRVQARYVPYLVRLVGGKAESYGRAYQLSDLYVRPVTGVMPGEAGFPMAGIPEGDTPLPRSYPNSTRVHTSAYMVRMVGGRVESYGRFDQLYDMYGRPVTAALPGDPNFPAVVPVIFGAGPVAAPPAAAPSVQADKPDLADQLLTLQRLRESGVLGEEEFRAAKAKLLSP